MRVAVLAVGLLVLTVSAAHASWAVDASGAGATKAKTMPGGNTPSASVSGNAVTLTWTASLFDDGTTIPSYVVRRFNAITFAQATVLAGCSVTVTATSCTESGVPLGSWRYTVTPAAGAWRGAESAQSALVLVTI
jgi:hypothetical protein